MKKHIQHTIISIVLFIPLFLVNKNSFSQDLHFSQYFNTPLLINPANTGFEPDADWRIGGNYRNQWASITSNPYKTFNIWGDMQLFASRFENGWMGIGGSLMRDVAGSGGLSSTKGYASIAYHQLIGYKSLLSGGFNFGFVNKRIDISKLTFDNQWNGKFFDIKIANGESFTTNSVVYADLQAGINYSYFPSDNVYLNAGISVSHINQPKESFFSNSITDTRVAPRYTFFLNGSVKLNDQWILNPNAYVSKMNNITETVVGMNAHYNLSGDGNMQVLGGIYYRLKDAIIPMAGFEWNNLSLMINYDATTSGLSDFNQSRGAYEISIIKRGISLGTGGKSVKCPVVRF